MFKMGRQLAKYGILGAIAFFAVGASQSFAAVLNGTFNFSVYQEATGSNDINDPTQQAEIGNPIITGPNLIAQGTYTGDLDFFTNTTNQIDFFLDSGGGTVVYTTGDGSQALSTGNFDLTTVFVITGDVGSDVLGGSITHDDGVTLYDAALTAILSAPTPVPPTTHNYNGLTGAFTLVYVAANDLPEQLTLDVTSRAVVPVPAALPLLLGGFAMIGYLGRRRRANALSH